MTEHADLEALSAFLDGEAPEWASHVAACPRCQGAVESLRAVAAAVGAPVEPAPVPVREAAVAAALDVGRGVGAAPEPAPATPLARRPPDRRWNVVMSIAAVLLVGVLGISALVALNTGSSDQTTVAGPALESAPTERSFAGGSAADSSSSAPAVPPTDLGDIPDAAALRARALPGASVATGQASGGTGASAVSGANSGAATGTEAPVPPSTALGDRSPAPNVVGTRPCEEQARGREPALGPVVFYATARHRGAPAVVLGFSTRPSPAPVTLLLLAQDGCAELLRTVAGP